MMCFDLISLPAKELCHLCGRFLVLMSSTVSDPKVTFHQPAGSLSVLFRKNKNTLRAIFLMVFDLNPFKPVTFFQQQKISNQKMPPTRKVLNRKK